MSIKLSQLSQWHLQLAQLMQQPDPTEFMTTLMESLRLWLNYDTGIVFLYGDNQPPKALYDDYPKDVKNNAIAKYIEGMYLLDPFYNYFIKDNNDDICFMSQMAPDAFEETEFYQAYYRDLSITDELCIFLPLKNNQTVVLSMARRLSQDNSQDNFKNEDVKQLKCLVPLLTSMCGNLELSSEKELIHSAIHNAFETFGDEQLTRRERQIARLILQGHSSKSLAKELGISPSTVKVHRKHIYERLVVSTQTELFLCFINHLEKLVP